MSKEDRLYTIQLRVSDIGKIVEMKTKTNSIKDPFFINMKDFALFLMNNLPNRDASWVMDKINVKLVVDKL